MFYIHNSHTQHTNSKKKLQKLCHMILNSYTLSVYIVYLIVLFIDVHFKPLLYIPEVKLMLF